MWYCYKSNVSGRTSTWRCFAGNKSGPLRKFSYTDDGTPLSQSFYDYHIPIAEEIPEYFMDRICTPTPNNSLGAKGIGESGSVGSPPAVVNAVIDALSFKGVKHIDMPITSEKVWKILNDQSY